MTHEDSSGRCRGRHTAPGRIDRADRPRRPLRAYGPRGSYDGLGEAWSSFAAALGMRGYRVVPGPRLEIYRNDVATAYFDQCVSRHGVCSAQSVTPSPAITGSGTLFRTAGIVRR
jgi:hypothetical protein